jgi:hypothetical protein
MYLSNHNNGLAQKTHCAKLCSIMNKDSLDGYFQHTVAALPRANSTNYCCLELDVVIRVLQACHSNDAGHKIYHFQRLEGQKLHHCGLT